MPAPEPAHPAPPARKHRGLGGFFAGVRQAGRDAVSVTLGRLLGPLEPPAAPTEPEPANGAETRLAPAKRPGVLHAVTNQLRGAADAYVAAKLDEIEARVDVKLDEIEQRIDRKIVNLHKQLLEMRDRELRHRLRLLKITLVFTVLVALLSLGYKVVSKLWFS